ncbi:MAG: DUF2283 domain-containing protein [Bacteroidota bacterium]|nr:DUF2283 domain-containing protein [Patescibacteria group bacterium]
MESANKKINFSYEPEADVISWELSDRPIVDAKEVDNIIIHFAQDNTPVLVEILEASKFLTHANNMREHALAA